LSESIKTKSLRLLEGERLLTEGAAGTRYVHARIIGEIVKVVCLLLLIAGVIGLAEGDIRPVLVTLALLNVIYMIGWAVMHMSWSWHRWWLTDRRLVVRHGLVGYRIRSVPLERIVDVTLRASWADRLLGLQHIDVRDMTGEASFDSRSTGLNLWAVDGAEEIADQLVQLARGDSTPG
jgi:uncharacterized membrane protein YdbT with pleckstrin-like domain